MKIRELLLIAIILLSLTSKLVFSETQQLDNKLKLNFLFYNSSLEKAYNETIECDKDNSLMQCINESILKRWYKIVSNKKIKFVIMKLESKLNNKSLKGIGNLNDQQIYQLFYHSFPMRINAEGVGFAGFSFPIGNNYTKFQKDTYYLFLDEYINKNLPKFLDDINKSYYNPNHKILSGIYSRIYMIMETFNRLGGVNDPPVVYYYNYYTKRHNILNYSLGEYIASYAYETTPYLKECEYHPKNTGNHSIDIKHWGEGYCPPENIVSVSRPHSPYHLYIMGAELLKDYNSNFLNNKAIIYHHLSYLTAMLLEAGIPIGHIHNPGGNNLTRQFWLESLNIQNPEDRLNYISNTVNVDINQVNICQQGAVSCKLSYLVKIYKPSNTSEISVPLNLINQVLQKINQEKGIISIDIKKIFYCPTVTNGTLLLNTLTISIQENRSLSKQQAIYELQHLNEECSNFIQATINNFLGSNVAYCNGQQTKIYEDTCEYSQAINQMLNDGILIDDILEAYTPVFFYVKPSDLHNFFLNKSLKDSLKLFVDRYSFGRGMFRVGNKSTFFAISKDVPEDVKINYPKAFLLENFIRCIICKIHGSKLNN